MKSVVWSKEAIDSIQHIYDFIYSKSPQNAEMVLETLFKIGDELTIFPEKNPVESTFKDKNIRFFPKWNFKIVYKIESDRIFIIDVFSTRQNY